VAAYYVKSLVVCVRCTVQSESAVCVRCKSTTTYFNRYFKNYIFSWDK